MIRITIPVEEATWRGLRDLAEERRCGGRASVCAVVKSIIEEALKRSQSGTARA